MKNDIFGYFRNITKKWMSIVDKELAIYGVTHSDARLITLLCTDYPKGCSQDELSMKVGIDRTNVGRSIKKLHQMGYLSKEKDAQDGRSYIIKISGKGKEFKKKKLSKIQDTLEMVFSRGVAKSDIDKVIEILKTIDKNVDEVIYYSLKK